MVSSADRTDLEQIQKTVEIWYDGDEARREAELLVDALSQHLDGKVSPEAGISKLDLKILAGSNTKS